jgi:hypothetical protein
MAQTLIFTTLSGKAVYSDSALRNTNGEAGATNKITTFEDNRSRFTFKGAYQKIALAF